MDPNQARPKTVNQISPFQGEELEAFPNEPTTVLDNEKKPLVKPSKTQSDALSSHKMPAFLERKLSHVASSELYKPTTIVYQHADQGGIGLSSDSESDDDGPLTKEEKREAKERANARMQEQKAKEELLRAAELKSIFSGQGRIKETIVEDENQPSNLYAKLDGYQLRWVFEYKPGKIKNEKKGLCIPETDTTEPYVADREFQMLEENLFVRLSKQRRAIRNWQQVRVMMLPMMKQAKQNEKVSLFTERGNSMAHMDDDLDENQENTTSTCWNSIDDTLSKYTINPINRYKIMWDVFANLNYIIGIFLVMYLLAFRLYELRSFGALDNFLDFVNVLDILFIFMTQFEKEERNSNKTKVKKLNSRTIAAALSKDFVQTTKLNKIESGMITQEQGFEICQLYQKKEFPDYILSKNFMYAFWSKKPIFEGHVNSQELVRGFMRWAKLNGVVADALDESQKFDLSGCSQEKKVYITNFSEIADRYLRSYFVFDVLSCAPSLIGKAYLWSLLKTDAQTGTVLNRMVSYPMQIAFMLKLFRVMQLPRIGFETANLQRILKQSYTHCIIPIHNCFHTLETGFYLLIAMHFASCVWIFIGFRSNGWVTERTWSDDPGILLIKDLQHKEAFDIYWIAMYFIVQTMTTVGYGDMSAYAGNPPHSRLEMVFVMLLEFFGILTLTYISDAIMDIKYKVNVEHQISEIVENMNMWLFRVDRVLTDTKIPNIIYDSVIDFITSSIRFSTNHVFQDYPYYKQLPPRLKERLVTSTLGQFYHTTIYFYHDFKYNNKAPFGFVQKMLTNLHCSIFLTGSKVVEFGKPVFSLNMFMKGHVNLYGFSKLHGDQHRVLLAKLPTGSWYGDYQILMGTNTNFEIEAGYTKSPNNRNLYHIQVYQMPAEKFKSFCNQYPEYRTFILMRSTLRRSYFHKLLKEYVQLAQLDIKWRNSNDEGLNAEMFGEHEIDPDTMLGKIERYKNKLHFKFRSNQLDPLSLRTRIALMDPSLSKLNRREIIIDNSNTDLSSMNQRMLLTYLDIKLISLAASESVNMSQHFWSRFIEQISLLRQQIIMIGVEVKGYDLQQLKELRRTILSCQQRRSCILVEMHKNSLQSSNNRKNKDDYESDDDIYDEANLKTTTLEDMVDYVKHKFDQKAQKHSMLPAIVSPAKSKQNKQFKNSSPKKLNFL